MIITAGEALVDLVPHAVPGGGPMNTAVACARLGAPTAFLGAVSTDEHGDAIWAHLEASGVDLRLTQRRGEATCRAEVIGDPPTFHFHGDDTADRFVEMPDPDLLGVGRTCCTAARSGSSASRERRCSPRSPRRSTASCRLIRTSGPRSSSRSAVGTGIRGSTGGSPLCSLFRGSDDDFAWIWPDRDPPTAPANCSTGVSQPCW